jgi:predicted Zn-dependent protease with MMP-like domain
MDDSLFEKLIEEALDSLPKEYAEKLQNVGVTFEDWPTLAQRMKLRLAPWVLLFGLYEGTPQTRRGIYYSAVPDKITIFKNSILSICRTEEEVKAQVRATVIHEIGHHFGLSDKNMGR